MSRLQTVDPLWRPGHDAVLFDLDGVLVDSRTPFARSVNGALAAQSLPARPEHELHQYLGPPLHQTFEALVGDRSLVQPCVDAYRSRYRKLAASETSIFRGIREILEHLSEEMPLIVATSKPQALAEPLLNALDLRRFFAAVVGPRLDSENEQKTVTVGRAIQELPAGARPVMVGDRKHDVQAAHAHGMQAIGVLWGIGSEEELHAAGANALVRAPAELAALLIPSQ
ncbi:MAG: HAD hydrolase-like protein [Solirubrobacterales bacterium]|nr:HAD hydrolase-like protein [Solirubrobacterales bacterium]